jgi:hypothetical protein
MSWGRPFWSQLRSALLAAATLACHLVVAGIILLGIWCLEQVFHILWKSSDPLLFDRFPIRYLFDAMDLAVIVLFVWYVCWELVERSGSSEHDL